MKILLLGNAGSGKSTFSNNLMNKHAVACLSLDKVAFEGGATRRRLQDSITEVKRFVAENESWIIEGCYSDIIEPILADCDELIFLNPGVEVCIAHCLARPWEPDKFSSKQQQDENLPNLLAWVSCYDTRSDEYGLGRHRALFASFNGKKRELNDPAEYKSV